LTVYVGATLMETDDRACSVTSFTMKPDNCQTHSLALSCNHIRLAYLTYSLQVIKCDQSYVVACVHIYKITRYAQTKVSNRCVFYFIT